MISLSHTYIMEPEKDTNSSEFKARSRYHPIFKELYDEIQEIDKKKKKDAKKKDTKKKDTKKNDEPTKIKKKKSMDNFIVDDDCIEYNSDVTEKEKKKLEKERKHMEKVMLEEMLKFIAENQDGSTKKTKKNKEKILTKSAGTGHSKKKENMGPLTRSKKNDDTPVIKLQDLEGMNEKELKKLGDNFIVEIDEELLSDILGDSQYEYEYFKSLKDNEKKMIIKNEEDVANYAGEDVPPRIKILLSDMPISVKYRLLRKIDDMDEDGSSESAKFSQFMEGIMRIPFGKYIKVKTDIDEQRYELLKNVKEGMDKTVYGLENSKDAILEMVAKWTRNPESINQVIGLCGPPGVGKTTLVKDGISKALGRPFVMMSLGGLSDASTLVGHGYTYEGAIWGRIAQALMDAKCMNPVIFMDELDKVSNTREGKEIIGVLTHLTDTSQNNEFYDKYFSGIPLDLSKALIIFSYNDPNIIDPILRDRIYTLNVESPTLKEKITISKEYLLPVIVANTGINMDDICIQEEDITYIIQKYTMEEKGVRNLKRCLTKIVEKTNHMEILKNEFNGNQIAFPYKVSRDYIDFCTKSLKKRDTLPDMYL